MKIVNKTKYRTADLKRWLVAGHKHMEAPHGEKTVTIVYSHRGSTWGCASYSGFSMKLALPGDPAKMTKESLAYLIEHEIGHNLGLRHGEMDPELMYGAGREPAWEVPLDLPALRAESKLSIESRVVERSAHAMKMLDRWGRKVKLAKTIRSKWAAKVRYYERKAAAKPPSE